MVHRCRDIISHPIAKSILGVNCMIKTVNLLGRLELLADVLRRLAVTRELCNNAVSNSYS